ncbi:MAG: RNase adapter RapZ [Paracoccaceae bacterium]
MSDPNIAKPPETAESGGQRLVFVTGPSGAGRSTAVKALEDIGFEAIDNLPLSLVPRLLDGPPIGRPIALGIDVRNRDFSANALIEMIDRFSADPELDVDLLYLDCTTDVLIRRFSETRRRHPMAPADSPAQGIELEIDLLVPIRARANILIDTSDITPHDLRAEVEKWLAATAENRLAVSVQSFSYKRGTPRGIDMMFDCRFLKNPYWEPALRGLNGHSEAVVDYVQKDPRFDAFFQKVTELVMMLLPAFAEEGKSHFSIGFGCTGGQHRSVAIAEKLANALAASGWQVSKRHRELERRGVGGAVLIADIGDKT